MLTCSNRNTTILVVGAGAVGGYFGGRLLEVGRDVTFLVRPLRAAELAKSGLAIKSSAGDVTLSAPKTVVAAALNQAFDLVLLSCKAYDLEGAIASFAPAVGPGTVILPLAQWPAPFGALGRKIWSGKRSRWPMRNLSDPRSRPYGRSCGRLAFHHLRGEARRHHRPNTRHFVRDAGNRFRCATKRSDTIGNSVIETCPSSDGLARMHPLADHRSALGSGR